MSANVSKTGLAVGQWVQFFTDQDLNEAVAASANKTCNTCHTTQSSRWHKVPGDKTKDLCYSCYQKARDSLNQFRLSDSKKY